MNVEKYWVDFLRGTGFPRDLGFFSRVKVNNEEEYVKLIRENEGKKNIAVQVFSDNQLAQNIFDTIFLDFDLPREGVNARLEECFVIAKNVAEQYGGRLYFSGARGWHVYIDIKPVRLNNFRETMLRWVEKNVAGKKYLDTNCVMDKRRIARVPFTRNMKTGLFAVPVYAGENIFQVLGKASDGGEVEKMKINRVDLTAELEEIDKLVEEKKSVGLESKFERVDLSEQEYPACIREFLKTLRETGELDHYKRLQLAIFLLRIGWSQGEIIELFKKHAKDFDLEKTQYQVKYAAERELFAYKCSNARKIGLCPLEVQEICPFYPSLNFVVERFLRK